MSDKAPFSLLLVQGGDDVLAALRQAESPTSGIFLDLPTPAGDNRISFIFEGLSINVSVAPPAPDICDYEPIFLQHSRNDFRTQLSFEFGMALAGGMRVPELARGMLEFAGTLSLLLGASAVCSSEARLICDRDYFVEGVNAYVSGGAFPALALVGFEREDMSGTVTTRGLAPFVGQELHLEAKHLSSSEQMRRVVRIVHDMATYGPYDAPMVLPDLDEGWEISIEPDEISALVRALVRFGAE